MNKNESKETENIPPEATETAERIDLDALREEVEGILKERDEYLRMLTQVSADFENYKKRNAQLRADAEAETRRDVVGNMLPVLDNLERAVAAAQSGEGDGLTKGVEMVYRQFTQTLEAMGVEEIPSQPGEPFDPDVHNAVAVAQADGEHPENTIYDVMQKGYRVGGKVIRYAMVRVAQ